MIGALVLALAAWSATAAAQEPPEDDVEFVYVESFDPMDRVLNLVALPEESLGLSLDPAVSMESSRAYESHFDGLFGPCCEPAATIAPGLPDEAFTLGPQEQYAGWIHLAWEYSERSPLPAVPMGDPLGYVEAILTVGCLDYRSEPVYLYEPAGDEAFALTFNGGYGFGAGEEDPNGGGGDHPPQEPAQAPCDVPAPTSADVHLHLNYVMTPPHDPVTCTFGADMAFKVDTQGGTWVVVQELPPPPPMVVEEHGHGHAGDQPCVDHPRNHDGTRDAPEEGSGHASQPEPEASEQTVHGASAEESGYALPSTGLLGVLAGAGAAILMARRSGST